MTLVHDPSRVPTGQQIRRLTGQIQGAREGRTLGSVLIDVWYTVVTVGLFVLVVIGAASTVHIAAPPADGAGLARGELPGALVVLALLGALTGLAGRLGPLGVGGGGAAWWLPMPIDRRGLLRPTVLMWPGVAAGAGAVLAPLMIYVFGAEVSVAVVLGWAAVGAAGGAFLAGAAALAQGAGGTRGRPSGSRVVSWVGDAMLLAGAVGVALVALTAGGTDEAAGAAGGDAAAASAGAWRLGGGWVVAVPLLLAACAAVVVAERRSGLLHGGRLRSQGSVGERARVAVLSLDLRELSRALTTGSARTRRRSSLRLRAGGPRRAVVLADLVLLVRSPRLLLQTSVTVVLAVAATRVPLLDSGLPLYATLLLTGFWTANTAAAGGRHAELAPVLDRLLPLSAREVRVVRAVVPWLAAVVWAVAVGAMEVTRTGSALWWPLVAAWSVVLAAAAVRSAYRPPPSWSPTMVMSPMGGAPPTGGLFKGLDVALLGTIPTAVTLYVGVAAPTLVVAQWAVAAVVVAGLVAMSGRRRRSAGAAR